jgi:hypothetical protein
MKEKKSKKISNKVKSLVLMKIKKIKKIKKNKKHLLKNKFLIKDLKIRL